MKWLRRWFSADVDFTDGQRQRLNDWRGLAEPDLAAMPLGGRFVVVDVESSGLDVTRDRLIAIGAIAVEGSRIAIDAGFSVVLRQQTASDDANILVHRIGASAQTGGLDPVEALLAFLAYIGKSPLVGFHAPFDQIMISNATRRVLGEPLRRHWIDLAHPAPALCPQRAAGMEGLDDWCAAFGIVNPARHNALADALVTAQLHLALCARAADQGMGTAQALLDAASSQAWLARSRR